MAAVLTVGGTPYTMVEDTFDLTNTLDERQRFKCDVIDYTGTAHFQKGMQVLVTDPLQGIIFNGYLYSDKEVPQYPSGLITHTLDCICQHYLADKRTYTRTYTTPQPAGKLALDQANDVLLGEGLLQNFAVHNDTSAADFAQGILSGTQSRMNVGAGDLELQPAGSDLVLQEITQAQFAAGTLTNMTATTAGLQPTTVKALKMQSTLSFAYGVEFAQEQQQATGTVSGTASGTASGSTSGTASGSVSGTASGNITGSSSGNVSGTASGSVSGSASGSINTSGSFTPNGTINISGAQSGEFLNASFFGQSGTVNSSGFASNLNVSGNFSNASVTGSFSNASVTGNFSNASVTGSFSNASVNTTFSNVPVNTSFNTNTTLSVNQTYQPKLKSKAKVKHTDGTTTHHPVVTVDLNVVDNRVDATIWTGSHTITSNDVLNYDIWISSTSPSYEGGIDLFFSDGTQMTEYLGAADSNLNVGLWDQNGLSVSPIQSLEDAAKDTWYTRSISLSLVAGKVMTSASFFTAGNTAGTFTMYIKNCYLSSISGSPIFGLSQGAPSVNPPVLASIGAYVRAATLVTVAPVCIPTASSRISPAHSISSVGLVKDSLISWQAVNPTIGPAVPPGSPGAATVASSEAIFVSYDGTTWLPCTNYQALPGLPAGANVNGLSLYLLETFEAGQDPTAIPTLQQVTINVYSAPHASTTDIIQSFGSTTAWNTGTYLGTAPSVTGDLVLGPTSWTWSNLSDMTFVSGEFTDSDAVLPTQSVSGGAYILNFSGDSDAVTWASTRFNFLSAVLNFTVEGDFTLNCVSPTTNEIGFVYRQTYWQSPANSFAYYVRIMQDPGNTNGGTSVTLGYGINSPPQGAGVDAAGTFTVISQVGVTVTNGTLYHLKVVVAQDRHTVYWNNSGTPIIDVIDTTYTQAGNIGIHGQLTDTHNDATNSIKNFKVTNTYAGIWTSPSINLNSLGTVGNTQISWAEVNPTGDIQATAIVQTSLDGGSTWMQCTNGAISPSTAIPLLPVGASVSGKSLLVQVILSSVDTLTAPIIAGLYLHICGAYPGSSGSRSTVPLVNDTAIRANVGAGFGTGTDGQTYTKVGTATTDLASNELQIINTTGDVHMIYGSRTDTNLDGTVRFALSASTITAGMELRYQDSNNFFRLAASTTTLSIIVKFGGISTVLSSAAITLLLNTFYYLRFRIVGSDTTGGVALYGKLWQSGVLEPASWSVTAID